MSKAARVSTDSIHHQFGGKDGLLDAAFESLIGEHRALGEAAWRAVKSA